MSSMEMEAMKVYESIKEEGKNADFTQDMEDVPRSQWSFLGESSGFKSYLCVFGVCVFREVFSWPLE